MSSASPTYGTPSLPSLTRHLERRSQGRRFLAMTAAFVNGNPRVTSGAREPLRHGNAGACTVCGKLINPKRGSRRQRYCSYRCRDEARRGRNFAVSATTRKGSPAVPRSVENRPLVSNGYKADFVVRPPCIVGPAIVIEREIIAGRSWESVTSPDGVCCQVARYRGVR